jgi:hypothetical protein
MRLDLADNPFLEVRLPRKFIIESRPNSHDTTNSQACCIPPSAFFLTHNHVCFYDRMKNLSKEPLRCPNRSQFGTGLTWMLYKYLPVSFYCAIHCHYRSTSLNFRFQRRLRSHSFMVHSLPLLVS